MSAASSGTSVVSAFRVISVPPEVFVRRADVDLGAALCVFLFVFFF